MDIAKLLPVGTRVRVTDGFTGRVFETITDGIPQITVEGRIWPIPLAWVEIVPPAESSLTDDGKVIAEEVFRHGCASMRVAGAIHRGELG